LAVTLIASPERAQRIEEALRSLAKSTRLEPACLACAIWSDPDSTVHYFEEWAAEIDLQRRIRSDRFTSLLAVLEASEEPPDVRVASCIQLGELDYIELHRN
jgi:quinol monooxygenase YgiN